MSLVAILASGPLSAGCEKRTTWADVRRVGDDRDASVWKEYDVVTEALDLVPLEAENHAELLERGEP